MPYIVKIRREELNPAIDQLGDHLENATEGDLNYVITSLVDRWLGEQTPLGYQAFNSAMGVLECAKLELYRRTIAGYEDGKELQNGDVYHHIKHRLSNGGR